MISGIIDIGRVTGKDFIENMVQVIHVYSKDEKDKYYAVQFDVNTKEKTIKPIILEYSPELCKKFLFIGNVTGSGDKIRLTVKGSAVKYLFNKKSLESVLNRLDPKSELYKDINDSKEALASFDYTQLFNKKKKSEEVDNPKEITSVKLSKRNTVLFTLSFNGKIVSDYPEYKKMLEDSFFNKTKFNKGVCYLCGKRTDVTADTTKIETKIYITDKYGFAPNMNKRHFGKNFSICLNCYKDFLKGETFIKNYLHTRFLGFDTYIIPTFVFTSKNLNTDWFEHMQLMVSSIKSLNDYSKFVNNLTIRNRYANESNTFMINLMMFKKDQSAIKVIKIIKDIPPGRLWEITEMRKKISDRMIKPLGLEPNKYDPFLNNIFGILPIKQKKNSEHIISLKKILNLLSDILEGNIINTDAVISDFVEFDRAVRFKSTVYDGTKAKLENVVYKQVIFYELFKELNRKNLERRGISMSEENKEKQKQALRYLGALIAQIGSKQFSERHRKKPILDKINFQGMPFEIIMQLVNEVIEKLKQYDLLSGYGTIDDMAEMFKIFENTDVDKWKLSPLENVFWILAGYSIKTQEIIHSKDKNKENETMQ